MVFLIVKFTIAVLILAYSGGRLVKALSKVAAYFNLSHFSIAFILMALATSIPELMVGINSALSQSSSLGLGTVLGSNIADMALVFGIFLILVKHFAIESAIAKKDVFYMALITILPILLIFDGALSRIDGIILLVAFALFARNVLWSQKRFFKSLEKFNPKNLEQVFDLIKSIAIFILWLAVLLISAKYVVDYGKDLAILAKLPEMVVGISIIALSTSLPELVFEIKAVRSAKKNMALGDLIGSVAVNSGLVLGATALIYPIEVSIGSLIAPIIYLLGLMGFFILNIYRPMSKNIGYILIISYAVFLALEFH